MPDFTKLPPSVNCRLLVIKVAPEFIVRGTEVLKILATSMVTDPAVFAIITPPLPVNGVIHSADVAVLVSVVLY